MARHARLFIAAGALVLAGVAGSTQAAMTPAASAPAAFSCAGVTAAGRPYANARYGFQVQVPSGWTRAAESDNGDGVRFQAGDGRVLVYASTAIDGLDVAPVEQAQESTVQLSSGRQATVLTGTYAGEQAWHLATRVGNVEYQVLASGNEQFFRDRGDEVRQAMCSLNVQR